MSNSRPTYPAADGEVVTEAHARVCEARGHATHLENGQDTGRCPRCGAIKDPMPEATIDDEMDERPTCLDEHLGDCAGAVEYRLSMSSSGEEFARCDGHYRARLATQDRLRHDYGVNSSPGVVPDDFDPSYAGETWDED